MTLTTDEAVNLVDEAGLGDVLYAAVTLRFRDAAAGVLKEAGVKHEEALHIAKALIATEPSFAPKR